MLRIRPSRAVLGLLLVVGIAALGGCARPSRDAGALAPAPAGVAVAASVAPAAPTTASATPTAPVSAPPAASASATSGKRPATHKGLSASDAKAIDAELSAIQGELDRMNVPNDSDFNGISSGLK